MYTANSFAFYYIFAVMITLSNGCHLFKPNLKEQLAEKNCGCEEISSPCSYRQPSRVSCLPPVQYSSSPCYQQQTQYVQPQYFQPQQYYAPQPMTYIQPRTNYIQPRLERPYPLEAKNSKIPLTLTIDLPVGGASQNQLVQQPQVVQSYQPQMVSGCQQTIPQLNYL